MGHSNLKLASRARSASSGASTVSMRQRPCRRGSCRGGAADDGGVVKGQTYSTICRHVELEQKRADQSGRVQDKRCAGVPCSMRDVAADRVCTRVRRSIRAWQCALQSCACTHACVRVCASMRTNTRAKTHTRKNRRRTGKPSHHALTRPRSRTGTEVSRSDSNRVDSADLTCRTHMAKPRPLANERTEYGPSLVLSPAIWSM